jgi:hypothetical protein
MEEDRAPAGVIYFALLSEVVVGSSVACLRLTVDLQSIACWIFRGHTPKTFQAQLTSKIAEAP